MKIRPFVTILSDLEQLVIDKERGLIKDGNDYRVKLNDLALELKGITEEIAEDQEAEWHAEQAEQDKRSTYEATRGV